MQNKTHKYSFLLWKPEKCLKTPRPRLPTWHTMANLIVRPVRDWSLPWLRGYFRFVLTYPSLITVCWTQWFSEFWRSRRFSAIIFLSKLKYVPRSSVIYRLPSGQRYRPVFFLSPAIQRSGRFFGTVLHNALNCDIYCIIISERTAIRTISKDYCDIWRQWVVYTVKFQV